MLHKSMNLGRTEGIDRKAGIHVTQHVWVKSLDQAPLTGCEEHCREGTNSGRARKICRRRRRRRGVRKKRRRTRRKWKRERKIEMREGGSA